MTPSDVLNRSRENLRYAESPRSLDLERHEQRVRGCVGAGEGAAKGREHGRDRGKEDPKCFCASGKQPRRYQLEVAVESLNRLLQAEVEREIDEAAVRMKARY